MKSKIIKSLWIMTHWEFMWSQIDKPQRLVDNGNFKYIRGFNTHQKRAWTPVISNKNKVKVLSSFNSSAMNE